MACFKGTIGFFDVFGDRWKISNENKGINGIMFLGFGCVSRKENLGFRVSFFILIKKRMYYRSFIEPTEFWIRFRRTIAFFHAFLKIKEFRWISNRKISFFWFWIRFNWLLWCVFGNFEMFGSKIFYSSLDCDLF